MTQGLPNLQTSSQLTQKAFPANRQPKVTKRYKEVCLNARPCNDLLKPKRAPRLVRTTKDKGFQCVTALSQAVTCFCPKKFIGGDAGAFDTLLATCITEIGDTCAHAKDKVLFEENRPLHSITSHKLYEMMKTSTNKETIALYQEYSEDEVRLLPVSWLKVEGLERFLAKQLSQYIAKNAPKHKVFFNKRNWTEENCEKWLAFVLQERWHTTIHAFQRHARGAIRLQYEIAIPLEDPNSIGCQEGCAGSNLYYPNKDYLSYTLFVEYELDDSTKQFRKTGRPVTGFLRHKEYLPRDLRALENPYENAKPWGGQSGAITVHQAGMKANPIIHPTPGPLRALGLDSRANLREIFRLSSSEPELLSDMKTVLRKKLVDPQCILTKREIGVLVASPLYNLQVTADYKNSADNIMNSHNANLQNYYGTN